MKSLLTVLTLLLHCVRLPRKQRSAALRMMDEILHLIKVEKMTQKFNFEEEIEEREEEREEEEHHKTEVQSDSEDCVENHGTKSYSEDVVVVVID